MAKARMIHNKISRSLQVQNLSLEAQLLFTWMIPHADDAGRIRGEANYIRATVVPLKDWTTEQVEKYIIEIQKEKLIYRWQQDGMWIIEFVKWTQHQRLRKDRLKSSELPPFPNRDVPLTTNWQPEDNQEQDSTATQYEYNEIESNGNQNPNPNVIVNKSESNNIADKDSSIKRENKLSGIEIPQLVNPKTFTPHTEDETAAKYAWEQLEPNNLMAFTTTYLSAQRRGLPASYFYQFVSEIKQDPTITKKGAVFNDKVKAYFEKKEGNGETTQR